MMYASKAAGRLPTLADFDAFLGDKFDRTLGALIKELRNHISVDPVLEGLLQAALKQRNWLAHYFRERSEIFISDRGCVSMIAELETAQDDAAGNGADPPEETKIHFSVVGQHDGLEPSGSDEIG
jgi:hypothetical protein